MQYQDEAFWAMADLNPMSPRGSLGNITMYPSSGLSYRQNMPIHFLPVDPTVDAVPAPTAVLPREARKITHHDITRNTT